VRTAIKVLIIDDEIEICYLLAKLLKSRGIDTNFVYTLAEAKAILKTYVPSLIFLDNHLPDGLGIEFANYLKSNFPDTKIVIITGHDTMITKTFHDRASEIVIKPFTSEKIYSIIDSI
jgi:DNA-binding NtrC family response regulator